MINLNEINDHNALETCSCSKSYSLLDAITYSLEFHNDDEIKLAVLNQNCYDYVGHMMKRMTDNA